MSREEAVAGAIMRAFFSRPVEEQYLNVSVLDQLDIAKAAIEELEKSIGFASWLIEWPKDDNNPVRWWNPAHGWMRDANKALGFARKTDADCYLSTMKFGLHLKVTEHIFVSDELRYTLPCHDKTMANLNALTIRPQPKSPHALKTGNLFDPIPDNVPFNGCSEKDCLPGCNLGKGHCQRLEDAFRMAGYGT